MKRLVLLLLLVLIWGVACDKSVDAPVALEEPFRFGYVVGSSSFHAQFFDGDLPTPTGGPVVAGVDVGPAEAAPGTQAKSGYVIRLERKAYSVALRLKGRTNGYWIARVDQVEALFDNQVSASIFFDVSPAVTPGRYEIELSGVDGDGHFGVRSTAPVVVVPRVPVNAPALISLRWDSAVDLDLQLKAPDGTLLSAKRPTTLPIGAADGGDAPGVATLLGDSGGSCIDDGYREEDVVFATAPTPGTYSIYVNPYSLCGKLGTTYEVTVSRGGVVTGQWFGKISHAEVQEGGYALGDFISDVSF